MERPFNLQIVLKGKGIIVTLVSLFTIYRRDKHVHQICVLAQMARLLLRHNAKIMKQNNVIPIYLNAIQAIITIFLQESVKKIYADVQMERQFNLQIVRKGMDIIVNLVIRFIMYLRDKHAHKIYVLAQMATLLLRHNVKII